MEDQNIKIPLDKFQHWMQQMLLDPYQQTEINPFELLPKSLNESSIDDLVHHTENLSAKEHFAIYQRSYIARLRNCMSQQFSALEFALGEEIFCAFADNYLASKPSYNYNLSLLGKHFSEYLQKNRPDAEAEVKEDWIDFMIELTSFEYALGQIFEQKADESYILAKINTSEDKLKLVPICELFQFEFPVRKFYSDFKNGKEPCLPFSRETYCMVLRHKFKLAVYDLHKEQYDFLRYLKSGLTISKAKIKFKETIGVKAAQFDQSWNTWKSRWIEAKVFQV